MEPLARHGQLPRAVRWRTLLAIIGASLSVLLVSTASVAGVVAWSIAGDIKPGVDLGKDPLPPGVGPFDGGFNVLVAGSDSAQGDPNFGERGENLNDVTMLLHVSADHSSATVVSFPRDLYVDFPECPDPEGGFYGSGSGKINESLSRGGLACAVLTVEELTGLSIPFAAVIEFQGVIAMSDAVGGVPVCVAERIEDEHTGIFLDPGEHTLQGIDALQFLRTRYGLSSGSDLARISNQQLFLSSLVRTIKSQDTLGDPVKLFALAKAAVGNMTMSTSLASPDTIVSMARAVKDIDLDRVAFVQYPSYAEDNGLYPMDAAADLMAAIAADQPLAVTGESGPGSAPDPNAPAPVPDPSSTATPTPGGPAVELPPEIYGQLASQHTCTVGRPLSDQ